MKVFGMVTTASSAQYTPLALESFFKNTCLDRRDLFFLIDNDGSLDPAVIEPYEHVNLIVNPEPLSFSANANIVVEAADRYLADLYFLNNDVIFSRDWLSPLQDPRPRILSPLSNREIQYTLEDMKLHMVMPLEHYLGKEETFDKIAEIHKTNYQGYLQVICLPFFAIKIPLEVIKAVGFFDENFGKGGGEDYDYCLRAYLAGYSVAYARQSYLLHFGGKSTYSGAETSEEQEARELEFRAYFTLKWGEELARLILFEEDSLLDKDPDLHRLIEEGQHAEVVKKLMVNKDVPVKL